MTEMHPFKSAYAVTGEQRLHARHCVRWPVLLNRRCSAGSATFRGHTLDMSIEGVRVVADANFSVGELLACRLTVRPRSGNSVVLDIDASVRVVYAAYSSEVWGFEAGLQFGEFGGRGRSDLARVLLALGDATSANDNDNIRSVR